jgi:hypothetical protein
MTKPTLIYAKTAFSEWIRRNGPPSTEVDVEDVDFVLFSYLTGDFLTLETKERGGYMSTAQKDTAKVISQFLRLSSGATIDTKRGLRPIKYHGHHLVQFQNTTPDDGWIRLDGKTITKQDFLLFLNFGRALIGQRRKDS